MHEVPTQISFFSSNCKYLNKGGEDHRMRKKQLITSPRRRIKDTSAPKKNMPSLASRFVTPLFGAWLTYDNSIG